MPFILFLCVIKSGVNIRHTVVEGRIQTSEHRHLYAEVALFIDEGHIGSVKTQTFLYLSDRADAADQELVNIVRRVLVHLPVARLFRDIVISVCKDNQMPSRGIKICKYILRELLDQSAVAERGLKQMVHHRLLPADIFLLKRKFQVKKIPVDPSGKGLLHELEVFLFFLLRKRHESIVAPGDDFSVLTCKTADNPVERAVVFTKKLLDFCNFFLIHRFSQLL